MMRGQQAWRWCLEGPTRTRAAPRIGQSRARMPCFFWCQADMLNELDLPSSPHPNLGNPLQICWHSSNSRLETFFKSPIPPRFSSREDSNPRPQTGPRNPSPRAPPCLARAVPVGESALRREKTNPTRNVGLAGSVLAPDAGRPRTAVNLKPTQHA